MITIKDVNLGVVRRLGAIKSDDSSLKVFETAVGISRDLIPDSVDLRGWIPPVRDQGSLPTCVAQAFACIKEYQSRMDSNFNEYLAPQFIYNLRDPKVDGMYGNNAAEIVMNNGVPREALYGYGDPETIDDVENDISSEVKEDAAARKIKSYFKVTTIDGAKAALKNGPLYIAFPCYNIGKKFWVKGGEGEDILGGHAVAIVGYNKEGFILRNSWGYLWGDRGYTTYGYNEFGSHWEIIACINDKDFLPTPPKPNDKQGCCTVV